MTRDEADVIGEQITLIVRQIGDLQVLLPPDTTIINGLCHSAVVLLLAAQRRCEIAVGE